MHALSSGMSEFLWNSSMLSIWNGNNKNKHVMSTTKNDSSSNNVCNQLLLFLCLPVC
jgi:hypothetical protein